MAELRDYMPPEFGIEGENWIYGEIYEHKKRFEVADPLVAIEVNPDLDPEFVSAVAEQIRIVRRVKKGSDEHVIIGEHDPIRHAFSWVKQDDGPVDLGEYPDRTIPTLHPWAYYGNFKPTFEDVIGQLPAELLPGIAYFKTEINGQTPRELNGSAQNEHLWPRKTILLIKDGVIRASFMSQMRHIAETTIYFKDEQTAQMFDASRA